MPTHLSLLEKKCQHAATALSTPQAEALLPEIHDWRIDTSATRLSIIRQFDFKNYYETLAFINAIAYVVHAEDHHPELVLTYNRCIVRFDTHSVNQGRGGLSENDFICAAKFDAIYQQSFA